MMKTTLLTWTVLLVQPVALLAQGVDNDVAWASISHSPLTDRRPICPLDREAFTILFQTAANDLTGARVAFDDGADGVGIAWIDATLTGHIGQYAVWSAALPAAQSQRVAYAIELIDGGDADYLTPAGVSDDLPATGWWTLDFTTLSHAPLGATAAASGTVFRVWAPNATSAAVRGTFNNWTSFPLTRLGEDFVGRVPAARPGHKYKFFLSNLHWRPDPRARFLDNADGYNSVIVDPLAYAWRFPDFVAAPRDRWVVYQLHVGTFAGLNDPLGSFTRPARYREVGLRAGHLAELGVNAVMLNPINEFPGQLSGGYNSLTPWAFESTHGSADDLKFMIDELHGRGIAVMLDTVWNHFPSNDNYLWNFDGTQVYFDTPAVGTPWGPQADVDRQQVFDFYLDSVDHVLGEYRMDGYRHDAVYELISATQFASGQRLIRAMTDRVHARYADAHVIAEIYNNSAWNTSPGGMNFDGQYHEAFKNAIRDAVNAAAFGDPDISRLASALDGSGPWVEGDRVFNYYELHDEAWPLSGAGRTRAVKQIDITFPHDDRYATGRTKLGNGLTILSRGMPAILQGTEWLEDNGWEEQKIDWSHKTTYRSIFNFYRDLIGLRTTKPALYANSPALVFHVNDGANVFAFERYGPDGRSYVVVANFSNNAFPEYFLGLPRSGAWGVVINSEAARYFGTGMGSSHGPLAVESIARDGFAQRVNLSLPPHGFLVLQHNPEYIPTPGCTDLDLNGAVDAADILAFIDLWFTHGPGSPCTGCAADWNTDGMVDADDLLEFLEVWFMQLNGGCT